MAPGFAVPENSSKGGTALLVRHFCTTVNGTTATVVVVAFGAVVVVDPAFVVVGPGLRVVVGAIVGATVGGAGASLVTISPSTQLRNGEITHTARLTRSGADVRVQFTLVAPATNGTVTLQALGNAVNGNAMASGDAWARATLPVTITGGAPAPDASVTPDASSGVETYDPSASMAYGGCGVTPRGDGSRAMLAGAAALVVVVRRRRRPCAEG